MPHPRLTFLAAFSLVGATLVLMLSATSWLDNRGWLWTRDRQVHRLMITPTSIIYAKGDPWPPGAPPRRTLRNYGFVATHTDRLVYRDEIHTYLYSPGVAATRIVERITLVNLRNIFLLLLIVPLIHAGIWYRHRRRERLKLDGIGRCGKCGYDLRATTGACPECGAPPPAATDSTLPKLTTWLAPDRSAAAPR